MSGKEAQLTQLLQPTVEAMGYVLWGIELISPCLLYTSDAADD